MSGALQRVVVDLTVEFWGSIAAAMLGDFGADVVRIDALGAPALADRRRARAGVEPPRRARAAQQASLAVDLDERARPGDRARARGQGRRRRSRTGRSRSSQTLGLDYETLAALRPDLIYARGSGFGPEGPDRDLPGARRAGRRAHRHDADPAAARAAARLPGARPDVHDGDARVRRARRRCTIARRTGEGQQVDTSLLAGNMYGASLDLQAFLAIGGERFLHPISRLDAGNPMSGTMYMSEDGLWVTLTMPDTDRWWPAFAPLVELDVDDPRFDTHEKRCGEQPPRDDAACSSRRSARSPAAHWRAGLPREAALGRRHRGLRVPGRRRAGLPQPLHRSTSSTRASAR